MTSITYTVHGPPVNCAARGVHQITGMQPRALTLTGPGTWCLQNATVLAPLTIGGGANVLIQSSSINSSLEASGGGAFALCASTALSPVSVSGATGFVVIGDPTDDLCGANTIRSNLTLTGDTHGVEVAQNVFTAPLVVNSTSGQGTFSEDQGAEISANSSHSTIACTGNVTIEDDGQPNTGFSARSGQCGGSF
jgi:hypothetical protein